MINREETYLRVRETIPYLIEDETDDVAIMATIVCELHHAFPYFHWTGFYRTIAPNLLAIGPYQGTHGCLRIPFDQGVCGAAARAQKTQRVADVNAFPGHIACSATTRSEIVIPIVANGITIAVLDIDSDDHDAFNEIDQTNLEAICTMIGARIRPSD